VLARFDGARSIGFLGSAPDLSPPQVLNPLLAAGREARVVWIWRFEEGLIDPRTLLRRAAANEVLWIVDESVVPIAMRDRNAARDDVYNRRLLADATHSGEFSPPQRMVIPVGSEALALWTLRRLPAAGCEPSSDGALPAGCGGG